MLPLFSRHRDTQVVYMDAERSIDRAAFLGAAHALARRLPDNAHILNLCDERLFFLLGFCAALLRDQCTLLPASRSESDLADIARHYSGVAALRDAASSRPDGGFSSHHLDVSLFDAPAVRYDGGAQPAGIAVELYTSGSTGTPLPHRKTWSVLVQGAQQLAAALQPEGTLLGSVPGQHMFGLESTIMLPMQAGLALAGGCPLLPQDIQFAMRCLPSPLWWATTPLHLRACVQSGLAFPKLAGIVCATQTLAPDLACAAESLFEAPVHEIYGCTEAGAVGLRRPARSSRWDLLADWEMVACDDQTWIDGPRVTQPLHLPDHIECLSDGRFLLRGRHASLIKVGGKRMHLDALNRILLAVPGVDDGVFFQPTEGGRLTALVVAAAPDAAMLIAALRKQIDPVFLPRPIHWVPALPRNALGKLPLHALRQLVDDLSQ